MDEKSNNRQEVDQKLAQLKALLKKLGSVVVAFSGGVDSTFLLKVAQEVLRDKVLAVTIDSNSFAKKELREANVFCEQQGIVQEVCKFNELDVEGFCQNPPNRCYICKKALFENLLEIAKEHKIAFVVEGSNIDDEGDYRPGMQAVKELGICSPLREVGLTKQEIRQLSRNYGLAVWNKPSSACLSSRFAYGEQITREKLKMVEQAEQFLQDLGFTQVRVRVHGSLARIEVLSEEIPQLMLQDNRKRIAEKLKEYGFSYVTMDLCGYRIGSMNESLTVDEIGRAHV